MTPGARVAAAIEVLDRIRAGEPAEAALTRWARASRFAGSGDRAAIRDHVFDALRCWRSSAIRGGGETGRARMIGLLQEQGTDPSEFFSGQGHAPEPLTQSELSAGTEPDAVGDRWNLPDWLVPEFVQSLGDEAEPTALALQSRAPVTLRVNIARTTREDASRLLAEEGIATRPNPRAETALKVTDGERRVRSSQVFMSGLVELQDAASQAAVAGLASGARVLDYCAGGGGKALALASQGRSVTAHDIDPSRMADLARRAERAGAAIALVETEALESLAPFDLVVCDAPCSGSGTWRRAPEAKWRLSAERLRDLSHIQAAILEKACMHVRPGGVLAYATCSVLRAENEAIVSAFLASRPDWSLSHAQRWPVDADGDGFFIAHLTLAA